MTKSTFALLALALLSPSFARATACTKLVSDYDTLVSVSNQAVGDAGAAVAEDYKEQDRIQKGLAQAAQDLSQAMVKLVQALQSQQPGAISAAQAAQLAAVNKMQKLADEKKQADKRLANHKQVQLNAMNILALATLGRNLSSSPACPSSPGGSLAAAAATTQARLVKPAAQAWAGGRR